MQQTATNFHHEWPLSLPIPSQAVLSPPVGKFVWSLSSVRSLYSCVGSAKFCVSPLSVLSALLVDLSILAVFPISLVSLSLSSCDRWAFSVSLPTQFSLVFKWWASISSLTCDSNNNGESKEKTENRNGCWLCCAMEEEEEEEETNLSQKKKREGDDEWGEGKKNRENWGAFH